MMKEQEALERLLKARAQAFDEKARPLADIAATRALTDDENKQATEIKRDIASKDEVIRMLQDEIKLQASLPRKTERKATGIAEQLRGLLVDRSLSSLEVDMKDDLRRALTTDPGTTGAGSETVPTTFAQSLITPLRQMSGILLAGATTLATSSGEEITFPRVKSFGSAAKNIAPGAAIGGTDPQFDQVSSTVAKYGQLILTARELIEDSAIDIESFIGTLIGQNVALGIDQDAVTALAPGAGKPNAVTNVITGSGTAATFDDIIDLDHGVIAPYRQGAAFLVAPGAVKGLRKLKDTTGTYLWQPNLQAGAPALLDGYPVFEDPFLDDPAAGKTSILFGSFNRVTLRLVSSLRLERSDQFAFDKDQIAWRGLLRAGVVLTDANALAAFTGKAA